MNLFEFLKKLFHFVVKVRTKIVGFFTGLPFWGEVEKFSMIVAGPVRGVAGATLKMFPFLKRAEKYLEIDSLRKRSPVILAISIVFLIFRGLMTSPNGHIGTDTSVFPALTMISAFNPFLGGLCGVVFGAADLIQKFINPDIYGAMERTDPDYGGAMFGYLIAYSIVIWMGVVPGVMTRVGRNMAISFVMKLWRKRNAANADGAIPPGQEALAGGAAIVGGALGGGLTGYASVSVVAPVLEWPAFYLRPDPDVDCYHSEVKTLRATAPNSGGAGLAGGTIPPPGPTPPPTPPLPPGGGTVPKDSENPDKVIDEPAGEGGEPDPEELPWQVPGPDGEPRYFKTKDDAQKYIDGLVKAENRKQAEDDFKNAAEQIAFLESIRQGLARSGKDTSRHDRELKSWRERLEQARGKVNKLGGSTDYQARERSAWNFSHHDDMLRRQKEKRDLLRAIHKTGQATRNLANKGNIEYGEGQTDNILDRLGKMSKNLVSGEGKQPTKEELDQLRGILKGEMDASTARDEAKNTSWVKDGAQMTSREVFTGVNADGQTSYKSMALRGLLGVATAGKSEYVMEVGDKMYVVNDQVMEGKDGFKEVMGGVVKKVVQDELTGRVFEKGFEAGGGLLKVGYKNAVKGTPIGDAIESGLKKTGEVLNTDVSKILRSGADDVGEAVTPKVPSIRELDDKIANVKGNSTHVNGKDYADIKDVLELQRNPQGVRRLKSLETPDTQKAFNNTLQEKIYKPHDVELSKSARDVRIQELKAKYPGHEIDVKVKVDDFRTPGKPAHSVNTDRDFRLLEDVTIKDADGNVVQKLRKNEIPKESWETKHHDIFAEKTGFDSSKAPDNMTLPEQKKWWAEKHGQAGTDKFHIEASRDYSDQVLDLKTGSKQTVDPQDITASKLKSIADDPLHGFKPGKETVKLEDPAGFGEMFKQKVDLEVGRGNPYEGIAQAKKGVETLDKVRSGYIKQGLKVGKLPDNMSKAMDLIAKSDLPVHPDPKVLAVLNKDLSDLGFKGGLSDFSNKMGGQFESLKFAEPERFWGELDFKDLTPEQMTARTMSRTIFHDEELL